MGPENVLQVQHVNGQVGADDAYASLAIARGRFNDYYQWADKAHGGAHNELGIEVTKRLKQMLWILKRVAGLQDEANALQATFMPPLHLGFEHPSYKEWEKRRDAGEFSPATMRFSECSDELEMIAEAFYYFAFRARSVIRLLPGLNSFEAKGVRSVRNHLIEHPERADSGVVSNGFGFGHAGPVIKAVRLSDQVGVHEDRGIFGNADEFASSLVAKIKAALPGA